MNLAWDMLSSSRQARRRVPTHIQTIMKNRFLPALIGTALVMSSFSLRAEDTAAPAAAPAAAPSVTTVFTTSVVSQYMFRGTRLGGPSLQPSLEVDSGNLALGIWASTPLADKVPGQSDPELDGLFRFFDRRIEDRFLYVSMQIQLAFNLLENSELRLARSRFNTLEERGNCLVIFFQKFKWIHIDFLFE